jgi:hypothetical protein
MMFARQADGRLALIGFGNPDRGRMSVYTLDHPERWRDAGTIPEPGPSPTILIAATIH